MEIEKKKRFESPPTDKKFFVRARAFSDDGKALGMIKLPVEAESANGKTHYAYTDGEFEVKSTAGFYADKWTVREG